MSEDQTNKDQPHEGQQLYNLVERLITTLPKNAAMQRKWRLVCVADTLLIRERLLDRRSIEALRIAQLFCDGQASRLELERAERHAREAAYQHYQETQNFVEAAASEAAVRCVAADACVVGPEVPFLVGYFVEPGVLLALLRDVFGCTKQPPRLPLGWQTWEKGLLMQMALSIYEDEKWDEMPILGDALEDAGCDDAEILAHCRNPRGHVRGCWVVDLLRGE
jgi:hypothetical protein